MGEEANLVQAYRQARRAFIAACGKAGADTIARVHPQKGPDGKPLFCDSAAFGSRGAERALLLIVGRGGEANVILEQVHLPQGTRLVAVHALDPFAWARGCPGAPRDWPQKTLAAIAVEDLPRTKALTVLGVKTGGLKAALTAALPKTRINFQSLPNCEPEPSFWQRLPGFKVRAIA